MFLQGTVVVEGLQKKPESSHKVQFALNWTASSKEMLSAIEDRYTIKEVGGKSVVFVQVVSISSSSNKVVLVHVSSTSSKSNIGMCIRYY